MSRPGKKKKKERASLAPRSPQKASKTTLLEDTPSLYTYLTVQTNFFPAYSFHFSNCITALAALIGFNSPEKLIMKIINCFSLKALNLKAVAGVDRDLHGRGKKVEAFFPHEHHSIAITHMKPPLSVPQPELHHEQLTHSLFLAQK